MAEELFTLRKKQTEDCSPVTPMSHCAMQVAPMPESVLEAKENRQFLLRTKLRRMDVKAAVIGLSGTLVSIVESELYYADNRDRSISESSWIHNIFRLYISVSTLYLLRLLALRSRMYKESIAADCVSLWVFAECALCAMHWPPFLDCTVEFSQLHGNLRLTGDALGSFAMLFRVFLTARLMSGFTKWMSTKAVYACREARCEANVPFAVKSTLHDSPLSLLCVGLLTSVVFFAAAVRTFERPYSRDHPSGQDFEVYWNSMWLVIVSMTTVGYGDFYPRTHPGRFICVFASLVGMFLISLLVLTLSAYMQFSSRQARVYDLASRLRAKIQSAGKLVCVAIIISRFQKLEPTNPIFLEKKWAVLFDEIARFKSLRRWDLPPHDLCAQMIDSVTLWQEEVREHCDRVRSAVEQLQEIEKLQMNLFAIVKTTKGVMERRIAALSLRAEMSGG